MCFMYITGCCWFFVFCVEIAPHSFDQINDSRKTKTNKQNTTYKYIYIFQMSQRNEHFH